MVPTKNLFIQNGNGSFQKFYDKLFYFQFQNFFFSFLFFFSKFIFSIFVNESQSTFFPCQTLSWNELRPEPEGLGPKVGLALLGRTSWA